MECFEKVMEIIRANQNNSHMAFENGKRQTIGYWGGAFFLSNLFTLGNQWSAPSLSPPGVAHVNRQRVHSSRLWIAKFQKESRLADVLGLV